jgi:hypothetical protein
MLYPIPDDVRNYVSDWKLKAARDPVAYAEQARRLSAWCYAAAIELTLDAARTGDVRGMGYVGTYRAWDGFADAIERVGHELSRQRPRRFRASV